MPSQPLTSLIKSVRDCSLCESELPHGVRPILQAHRQARILIAGQAPGAKVHASGIPFDDASGDRLREWMGITAETFYNAKQIAILPMAFCYPGKGASGDLPPLKICAETWRKSLLNSLPNIKLTLVIGQYAHAWHLPFKQKNLTDTVGNWQDYNEGTLPLPHPSPRNNIWLSRNPWFSEQLLPVLKKRVARALVPD